MSNEVDNVSFTEEQKEFVFYKGKKSLIFSATAGSGKTFCSVYRLRELLNRGVDPKKIIFFSFTNVAVDELKKRVNNPNIKITTIHGFCFWMLNRMGKSKEITNFVEFLDWYKLKNFPNKGTEKEKLIFEKIMANLYDDADFLESSISFYKLQNSESNILNKPKMFDFYSNYLTEEKKIDFSDILLDVKELLKENKWLKMFKDKYDYIFIDEYQDTSIIQMEVLLKLNAKTYYLIGDKNQSIYSYLGSDCDMIESMLDRRRNIEKMTLTTNFRSADVIVKNSNKFSSLEAKAFNDFSGEIKNKFINPNELIDLINNDDEVVVLARTNYIAKLIEFNLLKKRVPMKYLNFIKPNEIDDIKKGNINPLLGNKIESVLEYFSGDVGELIDFLEYNKCNKSFVMTIHKSKGKEFHTCVVVNSLSEELLSENKINLPENKKEHYTFNTQMDNYQEEKNIHYVAISRPIKKLYYMLVDTK